MADAPILQSFLAPSAAPPAPPTSDEAMRWLLTQPRVGQYALPGAPPAPPTDWSAVQQQLARQPVPGVNVHPEMQSPGRGGPSWIREETIEPVPFGSLADPVSQFAFMAAPGLLRGGKAVVEGLADPTMARRLSGALAGERGNLGPVPRGATGQPLPESVMRNEA